MHSLLRSLTFLGLTCLAVISVRAQTITSITPNTAFAGDPDFILTVDGANFNGSSVVRWNGNDRATTFDNSTRLRALITATDIATPGVASVTVFNPGSGVSNAWALVIGGGVVSVSAAKYTAPVAPESQVAAFGTHLATSTQFSAAIPRPTSLAGTTVRVRDIGGVERLAPLDLVSAGQVNYQMPSGTSVGMATVTVTSGDGRVSIGNVQIATVAPGFHSANSDGRGVVFGKLSRVRADGSQSFEPVAHFDFAQSRFVPLPTDLGPETDQVVLTLYGTGFRFRSSLSAVSAKLGGVDAQVTFAGPSSATGTPTDFRFGPGLDQLDLRLPRSLIGRGEVNIELTVDGEMANIVTVAFGGIANQPPIANAGPDRNVECSGATGAPVTLNGSGSSHPDGDLLTFTWTGSFGSVTGVSPTVTLPLGTHTITLVVNDGSGGTASDTVVITVQDTTPPSITGAAANPSELWPPNHQMVDVTVNYNVSDDCAASSAIACALSVTSNELVNSDGDGNTDWEIVDAHHVRLRAQRSGGGDGRVYTITITCSDNSGNSSVRNATVRVPKNQGQ